LISRKKLSGDLLPQWKATTFSLHCRRDLFFEIRLQGRTAFGQTPRPNPHKEEKMADVKVPQRLDPQDIVKLLVALRRALKAGVA
jgi:hypothetical protein